MTEQTNAAAIKALCKAQAAMPPAIKDSTNPAFKSKYADLSSVQTACFPPFHSNGFAFMHRTARDESGLSLVTMLLHESGAIFECAVPLLVAKGDMQGMGSAITYARRYGIMCLSGVAPEDDDGNAAAKNPPKNSRDRVGAPVINPTPPPPDPSDPIAEEKAREEYNLHEANVDREIRKIETITPLAELGSYWTSLRTEQPAVYKDERVIAAKDGRKRALGIQAAAPQNERNAPPPPAGPDENGQYEVRG